MMGSIEDNALKYYHRLESDANMMRAYDTELLKRKNAVEAVRRICIPYGYNGTVALDSMKTYNLYRKYGHMLVNDEYDTILGYALFSEKKFLWSQWTTAVTVGGVFQTKDSSFKYTWLNDWMRLCGRNSSFKYLYDELAKYTTLNMKLRLTPLALGCLTYAVDAVWTTDRDNFYRKVDADVKQIQLFADMALREMARGASTDISVIRERAERFAGYVKLDSEMVSAVDNEWLRRYGRYKTMRTYRLSKDSITRMQVGYLAERRLPRQSFNTNMGYMIASICNHLGPHMTSMEALEDLLDTKNAAMSRFWKDTKIDEMPSVSHIMRMIHNNGIGTATQSNAFIGSIACIMEILEGYANCGHWFNANIVSRELEPYCDLALMELENNASTKSGDEETNVNGIIAEDTSDNGMILDKTPSVSETLSGVRNVRILDSIVRMRNVIQDVVMPSLDEGNGYGNVRDSQSTTDVSSSVSSGSLSD